jgi:isopropylmalate/homocitrate/citramalate synthase
MKATLPERVTVYEVGPRDGLQNESRAIRTESKVTYIEMLAEAGLPAIEATAFVHPRAIPQLADAAEVMNRLERKEGIRYPVLVPNELGMLRALEAGVREVAVFTAASESFTVANINCTIEESFERFKPVLDHASKAGVAVRGYISTAFGCPYEGHVSEVKVREVAARLLDLGVVELSIGDTIGVGTPADVDRVIGHLLKRIRARQIAVHFHDTRGTALANVLEALTMGIATIDSSSAGLGGCPYAPGASGNLATEDLVYMLHGMGIQTGVDLNRLAEASVFITGELGKQASSRYLQAWAANRSAAPKEVGIA